MDKIKRKISALQDEIGDKDEVISELRAELKENKSNMDSVWMILFLLHYAHKLTIVLTLSFQIPSYLINVHKI